MNRTLLAATALLLLLSVPAEAARYIVTTRHAAAVSRVRIAHTLAREQDAAENAGGRKVREFAVVNGYGADLTDAEAAVLRASDEVLAVRPTVERHLLDRDDVAAKSTSSSPYESAQIVPWGVDAIHARSVWPVSRGAAINVAVLDTGIDYTHPDLQANYAGGANIIGNSADPKDDNHHGTHVSGTIAARDNAIGVVGVAPEVRLWAVKVLDSHGNGDDESVMHGVEWVIAKQQEVGGHWIMNLSLGSGTPSELEERAFENAAAAGILTVASAGNDGMIAVRYPAGYPSVLSVGASDAKNNIADFSNAGNVGLVAPGVDVLSSFPVGSVPASDVQLTNASRITAFALGGSPQAEIHALLVPCGLGYPQDYPSSVKGNIALLRRGEITFNEKVRNAIAAGAVAVVVANRDESDYANFTLLRLACENGTCNPFPDDVAFPWIPTTAISQTDGDALFAVGTQEVTVSLRADDYAVLNGTSMAAPHTVGAAALVWSAAPQLNASQVRDALYISARDFGMPGWDSVFGYGLVDAFAAAKLVAPQQFGIASPPNTAVPPARRPVTVRPR
jgi:subtilisin family serine protease